MTLQEKLIESINNYGGLKKYRTDLKKIKLISSKKDCDYINLMLCYNHFLFSVNNMDTESDHLKYKDFVSMQYKMFERINNETPCSVAKQAMKMAVISLNYSEKLRLIS